MNLDLMKTQLILHEGLRLEPYEDSLGIGTCLVGYNYEHRGWDFVQKVIGRKVCACKPATLTFTRGEALAVLEADVLRIEKIVAAQFPYADVDPVRQRVVLDMCFNLGYGARQFVKAIDAFKRRHWSDCVRELYASRWARQVDDGKGRVKDNGAIDPGFRFGRADRLATMVLTGQEPSDPEWIQFLKTARG